MSQLLDETLKVLLLINIADDEALVSVAKIAETDDDEEGS